MTTRRAILVLLFHYGRTAIIIMVVLVTFFPVLSNVYSGLRATDPNHAELFDLYHANLWTTFWKLRFPQALPAAFNGLQTSAGLAVVGATVGEFLIGETGGHPGLGVLLFTTQEQVDASLLFATAAVTTALAIVFFLFINRAARLILRHRG